MNVIIRFCFFVSYLFLLISFTLSDKVEELDNSCLNNTTCENTTILDISDNSNFDDVHRELVPNIFKFIKGTIRNTVNITESGINKDSNFESNRKFLKLQNVLKERTKNNFCNCDLTTDFCDINCCCDLDCKEYQFEIFSHCVDYTFDKKKISTWYCHEKPFFHHNDTRFIIKKFIDSLFCIASDNLPPMYSTNSYLKIEDKSSLKKVIDNNNPSKFKWKLEKKKFSFREFQISNFYEYGDTLWILYKNILQTLELPQSGFGKTCEFKKTIKFLENWKNSCYQNNLSNKNLFLFPSNFINFTIIALPLKFNLKYLSQKCPKNICRSIDVFYCSESWMFCKKNITVQGFCSENSCYNIVKKVRYVIHHNGSEGIENIKVYFQLTNASNALIQEFQVHYKWIDLNQSSIFERSGNPGYIAGKPIFIGTQILNETNNFEIKYITFNSSYKYLTLSIADKTGICSEIERYSVKFLENIKLKCSIIVKSNNFSTSTCIKLQNRTFESLINFMFTNIEKIHFDRQFVSKSGNIFDNSTESWTKIFFEKLPQNIITGQIIENEIQCSGLVTSAMFDIVHSLSKPETNKNHIILGVGIIFSQEVDLKWSKCIGKNCTQILQLDLVSFVSFHDISKPTRYHIAGGPNLDISLPYNFFYPFLSHLKSSGTVLNNKVVYNICIILYIMIHSKKFMELNHI